MLLKYMEVYLLFIWNQRNLLKNCHHNSDPLCQRLRVFSYRYEKYCEYEVKNLWSEKQFKRNSNRIQIDKVTGYNKPKLIELRRVSV